MSPLKHPPHIQQLNVGYCLPACTQMALAQLNIEITQTKLANILGTRSGLGTPFSAIKKLLQWSIEIKIEIEINKWGGEELLNHALTNNKAIITALTTTPGLPGWREIRTQHAVLIGSIDDEYIYYFDPALDKGPVSVVKGEFLLAWSQMSEQVALLKVLR